MAPVKKLIIIEHLRHTREGQDGTRLYLPKDKEKEVEREREKG